MKFKWKGLNKNNFAEGEIEAEEKDDAIYLLRQEGITVTTLEPIGKPEKKKKARKSTSAKITDKELLLFTKKLGTMMKAGLAIVPALEMLQVQNENPSFSPIIEELLLQINAGVPLSQCLERHPALFDNVYVNLIKAGEASGNLDTFLDRITFSLEKSIKIKKAIKSAMMYPIILLCVAFSVVGVMMVFVVPVFVDIFGEAGIELPAATKIVMHISDFLRSWVAIIFFGGLIVGFQVLKKVLQSNEALMLSFDKGIFNVPVVGKLIKDSIMARMAMILTNLIAGGVNLVEALEIVKNSISNTKIQASLEKVKREIYSGRPFSTSLRDTKDFPETMCGFIEVGEETGKLNEMLNTVALYYEEEFDDSVDAFSQLLEPLMIVFLGVVIGFILVAMYTPIFKMGTAI
ncbi:type II secretion system F family protein [Methylophilaceae bacterium]|jgi:type IV pilus assembly protein PilC|nr:type II secretion system F family protein [Methylophilaceae bacterium]MDC0114902.1 type II secretion system F family protein [Methylophilaceae bacterium]MDC0128701.1 type II secretion system F family protein [Methylophilaceae bacterium]|tara:strand:+ start:4248 stop:5459 length:1212 start_codon:yes stop_codon:yes gene_type:complete